MDGRNTEKIQVIKKELIIKATLLKLATHILKQYLAHCYLSEFEAIP